MKKSKVFNVAYVAFSLTICALPFLLIPVTKSGQNTENRVLSEPPILMEEGKLNKAYGVELEQYFVEHFALRSELVTANAELYAGVFGSSAEDDVIVGKDGWLFYADTIDDYLRINTLSERRIAATVRSLELMQEYCDRIGADFVFTIAPNKATLYSAYMPYYFKPSDNPSNLERLTEALGSTDVNFLDLRPLFDEQTEPLYQRGDSHWNNKGARLVSCELLSALDTTIPQELLDAEGEYRKDTDGDLCRMLYPSAQDKYEQFYFDTDFTQLFTYETSAVSEEVSDISTTSDGTGKLLMFRDSFTNSLLPLLSTAFAECRYLRYTPYQLELAEADDSVVIELVERNISLLTEAAPIMPASPRVLEGELVTVTTSEGTLEYASTDDYLCVSGSIDPTVCDVDSKLFVVLTNEKDSMVFEAFPVCSEESEYGFTCYIPLESLPSWSYTICSAVSVGDEIRQISLVD